jgi:hypothetical protein
VADRDAAKAGIVDRESEDPQLEQAFQRARSLEVTLAGHKHDQLMRDKELGAVGRLIGGEKNAPITIAFGALVISLAAFVAIQVLVGLGYVVEARAATLIAAADKCLALATLALGYVCGKSS